MEKLAPLPKTNKDISSNWKALQAVLASERKKIHPKDSKSRHLHLKRKLQKTQVKPEIAESEPDIWFDDVDEVLIDSLKSKKSKMETEVKQQRHDNVEDKEKVSRKTDPLVKTASYEGLTKIVAMDCEMVGVGQDGQDSILARVSIVNQHGQCVYDKFVKATEDVTDYRTHVSGVRPQDLAKAEDFQTVQKEVSDILKNRVLVGHALSNDLQVLFLDHPRKNIRDTTRYKPFRTLFKGRTPSLKKLTAKVLNVEVQSGEHSSVQDAQAAMRLYTMYRQQWEKELRLKGNKNNSKKMKGKMAAKVKGTK